MSAHEQTAAATISYDPSQLDSLVESLQQKASVLPGSGVNEYRDGMHAFFSDLTSVLPILEGPEPSDAFRQQLVTIEMVRDRLSPDTGSTVIEPTVDTGLRAATVALSRMSWDEDYSGQTLAGLITKLQAKVDELDSVRPVGRPYVAADAGQLIAQAVKHMAGRLAGSVTDTPAAAAPAEPAATQPPAEAPAPAEQPAPAEPAATEPAVPGADQPEPKEKQKVFDIPKEEPADAKPAEEKPADAKPAEEPPANDNK
jgi:hypothetical protein